VSGVAHGSLSQQSFCRAGTMRMCGAGSAIVLLVRRLHSGVKSPRLNELTTNKNKEILLPQANSHSLISSVQLPSKKPPKLASLAVVYFLNDLFPDGTQVQS